MTIIARRVPRMSIPVALMLFAIGCGGGSADAPTTFSVTGTVTNGGQPMADVQVSFVPTTDTGLPSSGVTDSEGQYELKRHTGDSGAIPGTYRVVLSSASSAPAAAAYSDTKGGPPTGDDSAIPEKWQSKDTSPKSVEVKAEDNVIDIDVSE